MNYVLRRPVRWWPPDRFVSGRDRIRLLEARMSSKTAVKDGLQAAHVRNPSHYRPYAALGPGRTEESFEQAA